MVPHITLWCTIRKRPFPIISLVTKTCTLFQVREFPDGSEKILVPHQKRRFCPTEKKPLQNIYPWKKIRPSWFLNYTQNNISQYTQCNISYQKVLFLDAWLCGLAARTSRVAHASWEAGRGYIAHRWDHKGDSDPIFRNPSVVLKKMKCKDGIYFATQLWIHSDNVGYSIIADIILYVIIL